KCRRRRSTESRHFLRLPSGNWQKYERSRSNTLHGQPLAIRRKRQILWLASIRGRTMNLLLDARFEVAQQDLPLFGGPQFTHIEDRLAIARPFAGADIPGRIAGQ